MLNDSIRWAHNLSLGKNIWFRILVCERLLLLELIPSEHWNACLVEMWNLLTDVLRYSFSTVCQFRDCIQVNTCMQSDTSEEKWDYSFVPKDVFKWLDYVIYLFILLQNISTEAGNLTIFLAIICFLNVNFNSNSMHTSRRN